jgi:2-iminobutanoate/2-iminopropanoate deaminase
VVADVIIVRLSVALSEPRGKMNITMKKRITGTEVFDILTTISPAVKVGDTLYLSGQVAVDPRTGNLSNSTLEQEVHQVMKNLKAIMEAAGGGLNDIVKTTVFITSMDDFPKVNEIYGSYFQGVAPARSTVQVAGLYRGLRVEIEAIAVLACADKN